MSDERIRVVIDVDLEDLVPTFLGNCRRTHEALAEALERGDLEAIRTSGHTLRGTAGSYGFDGLAELAGALEAGAAAADTAALGDALAGMLDYLDRVEVAYEAL